MLDAKNLPSKLTIALRLPGEGGVNTTPALQFVRCGSSWAMDNTGGVSAIDNDKMVDALSHHSLPKLASTITQLTVSSSRHMPTFGNLAEFLRQFKLGLRHFYPEPVQTTI